MQTKAATYMLCQTIGDEKVFALFPRSVREQEKTNVRTLVTHTLRKRKEKFMSQVIQTGSTVKAGSMLTIPFPTPFTSIPVVVVSPFYQNSSNGVGCAETITTVSLENFTVVSGNSASNYYVNWIAIAG